MKKNQNLLDQKVASNYMAGKPLPSLHCSRCNSKDNRDTSRHRSPNRTSHTKSRPHSGNIYFFPQSRPRSLYPQSQNIKINKSNYFNSYTNNCRPQSTNYNRDENRSRQPLSRNRIRMVKKLC